MAITDIKQELVVFLRNSDIFTIGLRGVTTSQDTGTFSGASTHTLATNPTLAKNVRDITIGGGLIHHWKLNETSSTTVADSLGSKDLTSSTDASNITVPGKINTAFDFTAASSENLTDGTFISEVVRSGTFTVAFWVKSDSTVGAQTIFNNSDGSSNRIGVEINALSIRCSAFTGSGYDGASGTIAANTWTHIAFTNTAGTLQLYLDGILQTGTLDGALPVGGGLSIGSDSSGGEFFDGIVDDVRIYDRVLSSAEVGKIYNSGNGTEDAQTSLNLGTDYSVNYTTGVITFVASQTGAYTINYDQGSTDKIYPDFPRDDLSISSYPRIAVDIIAGTSDAFGIGGASFITGYGVSVVAFSYNVGDIETYIQSIRTAFINASNDFYNISFIKPTAMGPLIESPDRSSQILQRSQDFEIMFEVQTAV